VTERVLTRRELNRATLERQMLLRREEATPLEVMERLVGLQAQEPPDPYVALWSRIAAFDPEALSADLEARRAVRAVGLLRGTIHLVSARDYVDIRPLVQPVVERQWGSTSFKRALGDIDVSEVIAAGQSVLESGPISASELGRRLGDRWPDHDATALSYAVRFHLALVQPPPRGLWGRGGRALLALGDAWLGVPMAAHPSVDDLVVRYLAAFGPATVSDARTWSSLPGLRAVFERLRPRLRTFRDEAGRELFDVPDGPLPDPETPAPVRLLPQYDNILLSHEDRSRMSHPDVTGGPYLRGSVLVDGTVAATWRADVTDGVRVMQMGLYRVLSDEELGEVEAEADLLLAFLSAGGERRLSFIDLREVA
jgi:hypothetical protein